MKPMKMKVQTWLTKQDYSKKVITKAFSNSISIIKNFSLAGD